MKKILILSVVLSLFTTVSFAANMTTNDIRNAIKNDFKGKKESLKNYHKEVIEDAEEYVESLEDEAEEYRESKEEALQREIQAKKEAAAKARQARKDQTVSEIDYKVKQLNEKLDEIENDQSMSLTEKTVRSRAIKKQIEVYNAHKSKLK